MTSSMPSTPAETNRKPLPPPSRRRDKPQLSCNLCRRRKLRCDRLQPCGTCSHRGLSLSCMYVVDPSTSGPPKESGSATRTSLHERIEQLEKLAISLAQSQNLQRPSHQNSSFIVDDGTQSSSSPALDSTNLSENLGRIDLHDPEINYVESTHWAAMLDGISELKEYLAENASIETYQDTALQSQPEIRPTLLSHTEHTISRNDLLSALPPKIVVDRLMAKCFMHAEVLHFLLHAPTFQKQYDSFWRNPSDVPIMWLGTLFGLLCIGTYYEFFAAGDPGQVPAGMAVPMEVQEQGERYRRRMIQCMIAGGYTRGVPFTIETIQLYLHVEFLGKPDSRTEFWLLLGVLVRLAYRLGYHRDASQFQNITPFEAEMRRRRWCSIVQMDTMTATQFGLPKMIDPAQVDVAPPHNLFDEDFEESSTQLPESRPVTTVTPSLYLITKTNLFSMYGTVSEMSMRGTPPTYTAVRDMDKTVDNAYNSIPPCLKWRPMTRSIIDKPELIVQRVWIRLLHLRSKCVLHRQYLRAGRVDKRWAHSRSVCINSALEVLELQHTLYQENLPHGRLCQDRWRLSSLIRQEYLLATAILCVDVYTDLELELMLDQKLPIDQQSRTRILSAFRITLPLWQQDSDDSTEAKKATSALRVVLEKAEHLEQERISSDFSSRSENSTHAASNIYSSESSSSSHARVSSTTEAASADWQPFMPFNLTPQNQHDGIGYLTPSNNPKDFDTISYDFAQIGFQAQDLMDILQEDYPSIL